MFRGPTVHILLRFEHMREDRGGRLERSQEPDRGWGAGACWKPSQGSCFLWPVPGSLCTKESDWIVSLRLESSAGSQLGDGGLGVAIIRDLEGLTREGFQGEEVAEPSGPGQRGRDDKWRLSGRWGGQRHCRSCDGTWTVCGVVGGLCWGVRKRMLARAGAWM